MKRIKIILGLVLFASVTTFAQSPRIKLNQITKDTVKGSVLISSPSDSGMVYSRDFFIAYGADTVLILYGDTLAATSGIISSVLSDGVTITGDGTTGNELKVDTATVISTIKGLVDTLTNYVTIAGSETITGAKTFSSTVTGTRFDPTSSSTTGNGMFLPTTNTLGFSTNGSEKMRIDASGTIGIGVTPENWTFFQPLQIGLGGSLFGRKDLPDIMQLATNVYYDGNFKYIDNGNAMKYEMSQGAHVWQNTASGLKDSIISGFTDQMTLTLTGLSIGGPTPSQKLDVNGKARIRDLTGTGGNAVYENGGVLGVASDARFKTYVGDIQNGIALINQLKPKYFIDNRNSSFQQLGFYAQEVKSVINEASYPIGNTDYLGINDRAILATTVKAIQEQQAIIETIQTELNAKSLIIETQQSEIDQLKTLITDLTNRIQILENK